MKKILAGIICCALMVMPIAGCSSDKKGEDKKFIVGFDQEFPPMGFVADDGSYTGFDLDVAAEVAERLGMEFVAQPIAWDSKDQELQSGNIDCIWNGFTMNGREDKYTWSEPYMDNNQIVLVKPDSGIETLEDLSGKTVAVQKDSSGSAALTDNSELTDTFGDLIEVDSYLNAMMELDSGAVDAVVMDEIVARYECMNSDSDFTILDEAISSEQYGVGFLLGNTELRDEVQGALEDMAADGTLAEISIKWFDKDITTIKK